MATEDEFDVFLSVIAAQQAHNEQIMLMLNGLVRVLLEARLVTPEKWDQAIDHSKIDYHARKVRESVQKLVDYAAKRNTPPEPEGTIQ
jgi:hypothetical protein